MDILEIDENSKYFKKPYDNNYYNNCIEYVFDLMVHWDIIIDKPQKNARNN